MIITTVTLRQTAVLQYLSGGAIATPIAIHNSNTPAMLTLSPTEFEISSALKMASLRWMGVALAVQDRSQSSMDPAKETVVAEGVSMFMEEMGSLMGRTSPDDEDDDNDHLRKKALISSCVLGWLKQSMFGKSVTNSESSFPMVIWARRMRAAFYLLFSVRTTTKRWCWATESVRMYVRTSRVKSCGMVVPLLGSSCFPKLLGSRLFERRILQYLGDSFRE